MDESLRALKKSLDGDARDLKVQRDRFEAGIQLLESMRAAIPEDFHAVFDAGLQILHDVEAQIRRTRLEIHYDKLILLQSLTLISKRLLKLEEAPVGTEESDLS